MRKHYTFLLSILSVIGAQAQITIGQAEMPYANDELVRVRAVTNPLINYTATGPAHTWNYANLAANQGDTTNYQTVASTNFVYAIVYADIFFNTNRANHAKQGTDIAFSNFLPITDPYTFRYRSATTYKTVGYGVGLAGLPVPIIFDEHDVIYELPLNYGDASSSHSAYHIDIPNVGYYGFEQDRENEVDGWGGITTPGGVFDVIRVKTTLTMRDSLFGFVINRPVGHEYKWLAQGLRVPVLQINTTTIFGNEVVTAIYYYDVPRTIEVVAPLATTICPGATLSVHYESTGAFNAGGFFVPANHFTAQLSDAAGSFANPVDIGDVTATTSGVITATIPANTPLGTGYRIRVISTSPDFIGTSNTFDITIGGTTVAAISASGPSLICTGETLTLSAVGGPSYQWQLDGTDIGGATNDAYEATAAGDYTVLVANACGSATSNTITVEVNAPPVHTVDETVHLICSGASVEIVAHDQTGQSPLSYQWMLNNAPIVGATDSVVTAMLGGIYTVEVINGTTGCGYITEDVVVSLQSVPTPEVSALGNTTFCEGGSVQLSTPNVPLATYQWYVGGNVIPGEASTELIVDAAGDYTVVVTNTDGCTSEPSTTVSVVVDPVPAMPVVTASGTTTFCDGGSVELSVPTTTGCSYQWYVDGSAIPGGTDTAMVATTSGDYTIVITNSSDCASDASAAMTVIAELVSAPGVVSTEPTTFCEGGGTMLIADAIADVTYQWSLDGTEISGANSGQLSVSEAGAYTVTVTSLIGCSATSDPAIDVLVNPVPAMPVVTASGTTTFCDGGSVELSVPTTVGSSYQWYLDGNAIPGGTDTAMVATTSGDYTIVITNSNDCASDASVAVTVLAELVSAPGVVSTEPTTFCEGGGTMLIADAIADVTYQWSLDGIEISGANSGQLWVSAAGAYTVTVTSLNGCNATSDPAIDVVVNPLPAQPVITLFNDSLLVSGTGTFEWYMDGVIIPGATDPWWVPTVDGTYTVQVTDANGCSSTSDGWIYLTTGVTTLSASNMLVMPNPSNGSFAIQLTGAQGQAYEILDATGKRVSTGRLTGVRTLVDMGQAEQGMYFLRLVENGSLPIVRIMITR